MIDAGTALILAVACPIVGALFALLMPGDDRLALRHLAMTASVASSLASLEAARQAITAPLAVTLGPVALGLDGLSALVLGSVAFAAPIALRAGAPRVQERSQFYVVTVLFAHGLLVAAVVADLPLLKLSLASIASVPMFALVALYGGPMRGTTTYRAALIWMGVDLVAMAALALLAARAGLHAGEANAAALARGYATLGPELSLLVALALAGPGFLRFSAGPFSVWLQPFLEEAPVSAAMLAAAAAAPLGALILVDVALPAAPGGLHRLLQPICLIAAGAALLSGVIALAERELRRSAAQLAFLAAATAVPALVSGSAAALAAGVVHVIVAGASLTLVLGATEAIERRFEARDATALQGLSTTAPLLAAVLGLGLVGLVGVPGIGAGGSAWVTLGAAARALAGGTAPAVSSLWLAGLIGFAHVLAAAGAFSTLRRLFTPPTARGRRDLVRVTTAQGLRLLVPTVLAVASGIGSAALGAFAHDAARERAATLAEQREQRELSGPRNAPHGERGEAR